MLIMEAARRIDEWDYIRERIPGALEVYRSVGGNSDLDETTAAIYDLVDGKRNVARSNKCTAGGLSVRAHNNGLPPSAGDVA